MREPKDLTRREFSVATAMTILSGVVITVSGCGDSSPSSPTPNDPSPGGGGPAADVNGVVGTNHGHTATITVSQFGGGVAISLPIQGTSNHPHTVELTAQDLSQIQGGTRVTKVSSNNSGHTHSVTFN